MNSTVTARVPTEIKQQVDRRLKDLGHTTTDLINAAYEYVLRENALPRASQVPAQPKETVVKTLSGDDARNFVRRWKGRAVLKATDYDGTNFQEILDQAREDRHARFA